MKVFGPRTISDFRLIESLVRSGHSDEAIYGLFKKQNWRSEVGTLVGRLHCYQCNQKITIRECLNCGQTVHEGDL